TGELDRPGRREVSGISEPLADQRRARKAPAAPAWRASRTKHRPHVRNRSHAKNPTCGGTDNIIKRLLIHAGAFNLGLVMRKISGCGTPRGFQGDLNAFLIFIPLLWKVSVNAI